MLAGFLFSPRPAVRKPGVAVAEAERRRLPPCLRVGKTGRAVFVFASRAAAALPENRKETQPGRWGGIGAARLGTTSGGGRVVASSPRATTYRILSGCVFISLRALLRGCIGRGVTQTVCVAQRCILTGRPWAVLSDAVWSTWNDACRRAWGPTGRRHVVGGRKSSRFRRKHQATPSHVSYKNTIACTVFGTDLVC